MRIAVPILSVFFSGLKVIAMILAAPVTLVCCLGLMLFTYKIVRDLRVEKRDVQPSLEAVEHSELLAGIRA
jgi:hypothetical protein